MVAKAKAESKKSVEDIDALADDLIAEEGHAALLHHLFAVKAAVEGYRQAAGVIAGRERPDGL